MYPALSRVDHDTPIAGHTVDAVCSRGKHLLISFSNGLTLHTHMRMNGSWHIYRTGERWQAPARDMRIRIDAEPFVAVGFNIPIAKLLTADELARHEQLRALGPDLANPAFDRAAVYRRWTAQGDTAVHEVLLNQHVLSGIGNELKSEVLFVAGLNPFTPASRVDGPVFDRLIDVALRLMKMNIVQSVSAIPAHGRRTTGSLDPAVNVYVYGRAGKPCRRCGTLIELRKTSIDARLTYWCPKCQPAL
jgi:endonuclease-8